MMFLYTQVHRAIMVITGLLTVIGVTLAFIYVGGWSKVCFVSNEKLSFLLRHSNTTYVKEQKIKNGRINTKI